MKNHKRPNNDKNCPLTPTRKNLQVRDATPYPKIAACFIIHDQLMRMHDIAHGQGSDQSWNDAINDMRAILNVCKTEPAPPPPQEGAVA